MEVGVVKDQRRRSIRKTSQSAYITSRNAQKELRKNIKKVSEILKKPEQERTTQDKILVKKNPELVKVSQQNAKRLQNKKERILEVEDEPQVLLKKCEKLAELIKSSKNVIVYTGAGISTAASIPDYRGPNGVWTLLKRGQELSPQDLSDAEPTFTHMSLTKLFGVKKVKHVVSQNCDGLHLRSGFPRQAISEVHGNMYIECCYSCVPNKEFVRLFDVTEHTGFHRHKTSRLCRSCGGNLQDTIVHFGEKGKLKSPYRWKEAVRAAKRADLVLCLGSSLKVLRKYSCLWSMDKKLQHRPKLVIVNLQWTPKDDVATLKINGKCDTVMMNVMALLNYKVPEYERKQDPIFRLCTPLRVSERKTTTKKILIPPAHQGKKSRSKAKTNISNSGTKRKSRRITNSLWTDINYSNMLVESVQSNYFGLNDVNETCKEMEQVQIQPNSKNQINEFITVPQARLKLDQHKPAEYNTTTLRDLNYASSWDVTDLKLCHSSDKFCEESDNQSGLLTCAVPQQHFMLQMASDHHWCDCKLKEGELKMTCSTLEMPQQEKCRSLNCCSVRHGKQTSTLEDSGLYKHEDCISFQNKHIPELVIVNLGINESQKCIDQYIFQNDQSKTGETVLLLSNLAIDNTLSNLLVTDVCQNSSSSTAVYNTSHTLDNVFCHQAASNDLKHSSKELSKSSVQINFETNQQFMGKHLKMASDIILLPAREDPVFDHFTDSLFIQENSEHNYFSNNIVTMEDTETNILTNNMKQQLNKTLQTSQTINNICHDHCYTLPETAAIHQQKAKLPWLQTAKYTNNLHLTCLQRDTLDMSTKSTSKICPFASNISHSVSSLYTYKQTHNLSKSSTEAKKLQLNSNSVEIQSLHMSVCTSCRSIGSSVLECHPCIQVEESSLNPNFVFADQQQQSELCGFSNVPTCILNMDDMKIVYTDADNQPELSLCFSDDNISRHTLNTEPADVTFPWNFDILVLPSEHEQFDVCPFNEPQTYRNKLLPDACYLVTEKSTFCCNQSHVNCFISDDLTIDPDVPGLCQPKLHSLIDARYQSLSSFANSNTSVPDNQEHSFPEIGKSSEALCGLQCDESSTCHVRDTHLKIQHNLDKQEVENNVMKKCHQVSKVQKSSIHDMEGRENMCRRKPSLPGWFGKGLIIKKKKR